MKRMMMTLAVVGMAFGAWAEDFCTFSDVAQSVLPNGTATFSATPTNAEDEISFKWNFGDGATYEGTELTVSHKYTDVGQYDVSVVATSSVDGELSYAFANKLYVIQRDIYVVNNNSGAAYPYDSWATAAASPVEAVRVAADGCVIRVKSGTYDLSSSNLVIGKGVTLQGYVSDPSGVTFKGKSYRNICVKNENALVYNITFSDGFANGCRGGNVMLEAGMVSNCVLRSGRTDNANGGGGGAYVTGGVLTHCVITNSYLGNRGDGIMLWQTGGRVSNCLMTGNKREWKNSRNAFSLCAVTGGVIDNCTVANCWIVRNDDPNYKMQMNNASDTAFKVTNGKAYNIAIADLHYDHHDSSSGTFVEYTEATPQRWTGTAANFFNCCTDDATAINDSCSVSTVDAMFKNYGNGDLTPQGPLVNGGVEAIEGIAYPFTDLAGSARVEDSTIDIGCYELSASFYVTASADKYVGVLPNSATIAFTAVPCFASGYVTYTWNFGDGSDPLVTTETTVTHAYTVAGQYSVLLTASDGTTESSFELADKIGISGLTCNFGIDRSNKALGSSFEFTVSDVISSSTVTYNWDFGDGTTFETTSTEVTHTYEAIGSYTVKVTATSATDGSLEYSFPENICVRAKVMYVSEKGSTPTAPYATPETAFSDLREAISYAGDGCTLIVRPGIYRQGGFHFAVTNAISIIGETGNPYDVCLTNTYNKGSGARNLYVSNPNAFVSGMELAWGYGGGVKGGNLLLESGTVSNCVLTSGQTYNMGEQGGGAYVSGGLLTHSVITGSLLSRRGDGMFLNQAGGRVSNCLMTRNRTNIGSDYKNHNAAHAVRVDGGIMDNCTITDVRLVQSCSKGEENLYIDCALYVGASAKVINTVISDVKYYKHDDSISSGVLVEQEDIYRFRGTAANYINCATDGTQTPNDTTLFGTLDAGSLFANYANGDYTPAAALKNKGATVEGVEFPSVDLLGNPRIVGKAIDIGCYEAMMKALKVIVR